MHKKTMVATGMLAAAGSGLITGVPASAHVFHGDGWGPGWGSHSRTSSFHRHHNRNWNANETENLHHIRVPIRNTLTNIVRNRGIGATGATGATGPTGPTGATGATG